MLRGKRILITGGAGFIGTTLARRLVDDNEIVAVDNLHRDALSGSDLDEHPNFRFVEGDVLDPEPIRALAAGATHIVHCAAIAGVDTVIESPVRTMRVNVIGTYNVLEAALATKDTLERLVEFSTSEVFGTYAYKVGRGRRDHAGLGRRGALDVRGLEARRRAHGPRLPRRARPADDLGAAVQRLRARARSAAARSARSSRPRSPGDDLVIHGDGSQIRAWCYVDDMVDGVLLLPRAPGGGRPQLQHRQRPLGRDDLRPRRSGSSG